MATRRSNGEGGLSWNEARQRWVGRVSLGYNAMGKRRIGTVSARTKTEALHKLRSLVRDHDDGLPTNHAYTVGEAVEAWLNHGLVGRDPNTVANRTSLARTHVIAGLGKRRLAELTAEEIDDWLAVKAKTLSTDTLQRLLSILRQSIRRAQARDLVKRNVALLCDLPKGQPGRPSKSLTREQAERLLRAANDIPAMRAYVVVSLLTGARTEELRALTWSRVHLDTNPPTVDLWRSVRAHGDTKTTKSRRTLELPARCVEAMTTHLEMVQKQNAERGRQMQESDLVFCTIAGTPLDPANVRRAFRMVVAAADMDPRSWTPRELRHSFVSLLSSSGMPIEDIAHLVGHANTRVTELVYRKELRPVLTRGAGAMDALFPGHERVGKQFGKQKTIPTSRSTAPDNEVASD
jgi:site-specific recombinase XerD